MLQAASEAVNLHNAKSNVVHPSYGAVHLVPQASGSKGQSLTLTSALSKALASLSPPLSISKVHQACCKGVTTVFGPRSLHDSGFHNPETSPCLETSTNDSEPCRQVISISLSRPNFRHRGCGTSLPHIYVLTSVLLPEAIKVAVFQPCLPCLPCDALVWSQFTIPELRSYPRWQRIRTIQTKGTT